MESAQLAEKPLDGLEPELEAGQPSVEMVPISQPVYDEFDRGVVNFIRHGVNVLVIKDRSIVFNKSVWERGTDLFPTHRSYERRIKRATKRAEKIAGALAVEHAAEY